MLRDAGSVAWNHLAGCLAVAGEGLQAPLLNYFTPAQKQVGGTQSSRPWGTPTVTSTLGHAPMGVGVCTLEHVAASDKKGDRWADWPSRAR